MVVSRACRASSVHSLPGVADLVAVVVDGDGWRDRARGVPAGEVLKRRGFAAGPAEALRLLVFSGEGVSTKKLAVSSFSLFALFTSMLE